MIKSIGLKIGLLSAAIFILAFGASAQQSATPVEAVQELAALPDASIPEAIKSAVNAPDRSAEDKQLDSGRQPAQMLAFFGIKPGMQVADIFAGGGYTTELLSRVVGPNGKVYSQNGPFPDRFKKIGDAWHARLKNPALSNVVAVEKPFGAPDMLTVPPGSLDAVIMNMNYHDMVLFKIDRDKVNAVVFMALKPGGFYDIVDHSAKNGSGIQDVSLHRIDEKFLVDEIEKSGFKLAAASSALRHPDDDRTWNVFKKRGQTDRFMLKFVKPQ
jgi:predicted methyltransferase